MIDPFNKGNERFETKRMAGKEEINEETSPISLVHGKAIIKEIGRLYRDNYQNLFMPRLERESNTAHNRNEEFSCLQRVYEGCRGMLKKLVYESGREGNQISSLKSTIDRLKLQFVEVAKEVDKKNPKPKALRKSYD